MPKALVLLRIKSQFLDQRESPGWPGFWLPLRAWLPCPCLANPAPAPAPPCRPWTTPTMCPAKDLWICCPLDLRMPFSQTPSGLAPCLHSGFRSIFSLSETSCLCLLMGIFFFLALIAARYSIRYLALCSRSLLLQCKLLEVGAFCLFCPLLYHHAQSRPRAGAQETLEPSECTDEPCVCL